MTVKLKLLTIIVALLQTLGLAAQQPTAEQQIQQASNVYEQALTQKNEPLLKSILADNFILTTASGKVLTKKDMMLNLTKEGTKYDKFESSDVLVSVLNEAAIETGKVHTVGIRGGKKIAETTRYTDFWVKI